jgi:outer membrane biogenesis lipoprotein LolB
LEAHSRQFHFGPSREAADEDRDLRAGGCGWEVVYLGWYAQRRPAEVAELVADVPGAARVAEKCVGSMHTVVTEHTHFTATEA